MKMELKIVVLFVLAFCKYSAGQRGPPQQSDAFIAVPPCGVDEVRNNQRQSFFHAPARVVPPAPVDPQLKRGFLNLFHREFNTDHSHNSPLDPPDFEQPSMINATIINQINELCNHSSFFYSFAPRHAQAIMLLQQAFMRRQNASQLLRVARHELHRHEINPRVWFYALLGAIQSRPDLNGYALAWAIDATPDLYLTNSVLNAATMQSKRPKLETVTSQCTTAVGIQATDVRFVIPPEQRRGKREAQNGLNDGPNGLNWGMFQQQQQPQNVQPPLQPFQIPPQQFQPQQFQPQPQDPQQFQPQPTQPQFQQPQQQANNQPNLQQPRPQGKCVLYRGTQGATGPENLLWYFREDVMVNHHHWYWHQAYPQQPMRPIDRRGEMFFYMHHNLIARYNAERLSNNLWCETPLDLRLGANIGSAYYSDLVDKASGRFWTPRLANMPLSDISHGADPDFTLNITMTEAATIYDMLLSHIADGFLAVNRSNMEYPVNVRNTQGVEHVGNTVEAAEELSTHADRYHPFGVHNLGHVAVALATDPDYRCQLPTGVMADLTVTMRDPAFYKVHSLVDVVMERYKATLEPYQISAGEFPLAWDGVNVRSVELFTAGQGRSNFVRTFWNMKRFPLEEGIDGSIHEGDLKSEICHQHLDHEQFQFRLTVDVSNCWRSRSGMGTVRLFMAPRYDLDGRRFGMDESRRLMFQLDMFQVLLRPGRNILTRNSQDSSATKPWVRSLIEMLNDPDNRGRGDHCGCGWPRHLYIPKGTKRGMEFDLFAMVTNYDDDTVVDTVADTRFPEPCNSPFLYCGIPYRRYPDARPLGYPFDRRAYSVLDLKDGRVRQVNYLEEYVSHVPNMQSSVLVIQHLDQIIRR